MPRPRAGSTVSAVARVAGLLGVLMAGSAQARLRVEGTGKAQVLTRSQFRADQQQRYDIFRARCTKCHAMARPIAALQTGITPVSGNTFTKPFIRHYVVKMMRKPNSGIGRDEAREIIVFLEYAYDLARAP